MNRISLGGTYNLRDAAGLLTAHGSQLQQGILFRSDSLHSLTDDGRALLVALGIRTVLDLRSEGEVGRAPDSLAGLDIRLLHLPLYEGAEPAKQIDLSLGLYAMYRDLVASAGGAIAEVAREIARSDGAVLVHCTAGKDRTGLAVAVVLEAVGVDRDLVVADYVSSAANLEGEWAETYLVPLTHHLELDADTLTQFMTSSPADLLIQVLDEMDKDFGGADGYLREHGLSADDLERLRRKILTPHPQPHEEREKS